MFHRFLEMYWNVTIHLNRPEVINIFKDRAEATKTDLERRIYLQNLYGEGTNLKKSSKCDG